MTCFFLIQGFDKHCNTLFTPDPAIFKTEEETLHFIELHTTESLMFGYQIVRLGYYSLEDLE